MDTNDRRQEIIRRAEHVAQMQRDGESSAVIYAMTRFWAKKDEIDGHKRPRRPRSD